MKLRARRVLTPIGIDVDGRSIAAAQLSRQGHQWRIEAATVLDRIAPDAPLDDHEVQRLSEVLMRQGFLGKDIVLAAPNEKLLTGVLDLPPASSGAPVEQLTRMELARLHKCEPDSFELSFWELPARQRGAGGPTPAESRSASTVMATACATDDSASLLDLFESHGWNVCALDVQSWALVRACEQATADPGASAALLNLRWENAVLALRYQNVVVYERTLDHAGVQPLHHHLTSHGLAPALADLVLFREGTARDGRDKLTALHSAVSAESRRLMSMHLDSIVDEVRSSCSYMAHQYVDSSPKTLLLTGEGASMPGAIERFSRELEMEVKVIAASDIATCNPALASICGHPGGTSLVAAIGLAQHGREGT